MHFDYEIANTLHRLLDLGIPQWLVIVSTLAIASQKERESSKGVGELPVAPELPV